VSHINSVTLSGRLTRDVELRHLPSGSPVASFGVAVERYNKNDPEKPYVGFFDCKVFGAFGELVCDKAKKGDHVFVEGRLDFSSWEAQDGSKRSKVEVVVNTMDGEFLFRKRGEGSGTGSAPPDQEALTGTKPADDDIPF
jgi:single-strand DNA-binding protein